MKNLEYILKPVCFTGLVQIFRLNDNKFHKYISNLIDQLLNWVKYDEFKHSGILMNLFKLLFEFDSYIGKLFASVLNL